MLEETWCHQTAKALPFGATAMSASAYVRPRVRGLSHPCLGWYR
ncbi:MAG: hypothetical protein WAV00_08610 [Nocardioides sp.]